MLGHKLLTAISVNTKKMKKDLKDSCTITYSYSSYMTEDEKKIMKDNLNECAEISRNAYARHLIEKGKM